MSKEKAINEILESLFTNGSGQKATRLVLWDDNKDFPANNLGGWSKSAIASKLTEFLDAGHQAEQTAWVPIRSSEDLPKVKDFYLWIYRSNGGATVQHFGDTTPLWYADEYDAWLPIPPYTADSGKENG